MKSDIIIRPAMKSDLHALGILGAELVRLHHAFDPDRFMTPGPESARGYAWFLGTLIEDPEVVLLVADAGGDIVGYVYAGLEPLSWKELRGPAGFIQDVVVMEAARRSGIATELVEAAADKLEELGAPRVMLWTAEKNAGARKLFERLGFRPTMIEMTRERRRR
jgi:ribosomal protein S18 acetylase RimI-like enzyme